MVCLSIEDAILQIHGIQRGELFDLYHLQKTDNIDTLKDFHLVKNQIAFGLYGDHTQLLDPYCERLVIGGPCICYCQASIDRITVQDIVDIVNPIAFGKYINAPIYIYLQIYEAILQQQEIDAFTSDETLWHNLFLSLEKLVYHIASLLQVDADNVNILSTSDPRIKHTIDVVLAEPKLQRYLSNEFLYGMYSVNNQTLHPKGDSAEALFLDIYKRNLATYLPQTLSQLTSRKKPHVIVVENCTQLKTSIKADQISNDVFNHKNGVSHLAYISTPGTNGLEMYKCFSRKQLRVGMPDDLLEKRLQHIDDITKFYYMHIWPDQLTNAKSGTMQQFIRGIHDICTVVR